MIAPAPAPLAMPVLPEPQITHQGAARRDGRRPEERKYTGAPISLDFKDGDLQDIFRLFSDISGSNVVVNPGVSGKVTLKLQEVPWDQALDLILKTNGLGSTVENNVIRIAKLSDLQKEEQDRRKLQEEKALAGDLTVVRKRLSYAKAADLEADGQEGGAVGARQHHARHPHQHHDHHGPRTEHQEGERPHRRPRPRHSAGGDRGADRGHEPRLHA